MSGYGFACQVDDTWTNVDRCWSWSRWHGSYPSWCSSHRSLAGSTSSVSVQSRPASATCSTWTTPYSTVCFRSTLHYFVQQTIGDCRVAATVIVYLFRLGDSLPPTGVFITTKNAQFMTKVTRPPSDLRQTTHECMYLVSRAHWAL